MADADAGDFRFIVQSRGIFVCHTFIYVTVMQYNSNIFPRIAIASFNLLLFAGTTCVPFLP